MFLKLFPVASISQLLMLVLKKVELVCDIIHAYRLPPCTIKLLGSYNVVEVQGPRKALLSAILTQAGVASVCPLGINVRSALNAELVCWRIHTQADPR